MNYKDNDALKYFKMNKVWNRLFRGFKVKYESYGYFTGTVKLTGLSIEEIEVLEGFFGKNFHGQKSISISAKAFERALLKSRYSDYKATEILELFFGDSLLGKKEVRAAFDVRKSELENEIFKEFDKTYAALLFERILENVKPEVSRNIIDVSYKKQAEVLTRYRESLRLACRIVNEFPYLKNETMYVAIFAAKLTGNPHAFDVGTWGGNILGRLVDEDIRHREIVINDEIVFRSYKKQRKYLEVGLLVDDVSNSVMLYGAEAITKNGAKHLGMSGFCSENDMVEVPLSVMLKWDSMKCHNDRIIVVENPSVFAILCGKAEKLTSLMCVNGQPRLATLVALDLLARAGTSVFYAGDLDPEGLLIGQKLYDYYKGEFNFIGMSVDDYEVAMSSETISAKRLKMLDKITHPMLLKTAEQIRKHEKAGYQELVITSIIDIMIYD